MVVVLFYDIVCIFPSYYKSKNVIMIKKDKLQSYIVFKVSDSQSVVDVQKGSIHEMIVKDNLKGADMIPLTKVDEMVRVFYRKVLLKDI